MNIIQELEAAQVAKLAAVRAIPEFQPGDTLIVNVKVKEGERTRVQAYEGVCIARSKLYYLRDRRGKSARIAERLETPAAKAAREAAKKQAKVNGADKAATGKAPDKAKAKAAAKPSGK